MFTFILWMEISQCNDFMTFGNALHHVVAAVFTTAHHCDHTHVELDD